MFGKDARVVELSGGSYFDVTHSGIPFIVKSKFNGCQGTRNHVQHDSLSRGSGSDHHPVNGKVAVTCHSQTDTTTRTTVLTPDCKPDSNRGKACCQVDSVDVEEQTAWRRGEFTFEDVDLGSIMTIIGRSFALNVTFDDPELQDIKCFISIQRDKGYEDILKIIHMATGVKFKKDGNEIRVYK